VATGTGSGYILEHKIQWL